MRQPPINIISILNPHGAKYSWNGARRANGGAGIPALKHYWLAASQIRGNNCETTGQGLNRSIF
jgi:hypothetical protein